MCELIYSRFWKQLCSKHTSTVSAMITKEVNLTELTWTYENSVTYLACNHSIYTFSIQWLHHLPKCAWTQFHAQILCDSGIARILKLPGHQGWIQVLGKEGGGGGGAKEKKGLGKRSHEKEKKKCKFIPYLFALLSVPNG